MLVMQAAAAQTIWNGTQFESTVYDQIARRVLAKMAVKRLHERYQKKNIVLCGFMGSGKTTVGRKLARLTGLTHIDADTYLEQKTGKTILKSLLRKAKPLSAIWKPNICGRFVPKMGS